MYQVIVYRMFDSVYCAELTGGGDAWSISFETNSGS